MFHLAAYTTALGVGTDIDVPALSDDILQINNTHFTLMQPYDLIACFAQSPLLDRIKLASPTMRQLAAPFIRPVSQGLVGSTNYNAALWDQNPYRLQPFEEIQLLATSTIGAMTERFFALLFLQMQYTPIPPGGWTPLRFTSTGAAVANAWTTVAITFADTVPSGVYAAVLSECFSTNGQAHRWIFSNQNPRPGFNSFVNAFSRHPYAISKGQFGQLGVFRSNDLPRLQVLCNGADAVHTGYLSVVKLGPIPG